VVAYPVKLTRDDNDTVLVIFPDFPEAGTVGEDRDEALARAVDALETIIEAYIRDRQRLPNPSAGKLKVCLPPLAAAKVQLYKAMHCRRIRKTHLAKLLNVHLPQIDRLLDLRHASRIEQIDAAARVLGGHVDVNIQFDQEPQARVAAAGGRRRR
jgi:antitoxin HicB